MAQFDTAEIVIGGSEWETAPFRFNRMTILGGSGQSYINVLLSGVSPLALTNALGLKYIKALGKCEQNGTPSPDNPVNIVCNNGILKVRNKSGIPLGYQAVEYLQSSGSQYIDTGIVLNSIATITTVGQFLVRSTSSNPITMWGFLGSTKSLPRWGCSIHNSRWLLDLNSTSFTTPLADLDKHTFVQNCTDTTYDGIIDGVSIYSEEKPIASGSTYTSNILSVYIFARNNSNTAGNFSSSRIYSFNIVQDDELVINLIPCRRKSDNVLGMYDLVSDTFLTNDGTGDFTAGQDINNMEIYADGIQETVTVSGKNLFDKNAILENTRFSNTTGYVYDTTGDVVSNIGRYISDLIPVQVGNTYTKNTTTDAYHRVKTYDSNKTCLRYLDDSSTITIQENEAYIAISGYLTEIDDVQLELGSTATTYEPYFNGGTANAEILLKVENFIDNQEILTGKITRNIGIKVLNGTEDWILNTGRRYYIELNNIKYSEDFTPYCTHFIAIPSSAAMGGYTNQNVIRVGHGTSTTIDPWINRILIQSMSHSSVTAFTSWLQQQYTNGTPVIVIYPLATPTTETVTGQTLTAKDNCTVIATGSLNNLELELSYKQSI